MLLLCVVLWWWHDRCCGRSYCILCDWGLLHLELLLPHVFPRWLGRDVNSVVLVLCCGLLIPSVIFVSQLID